MSSGELVGHFPPHRQTQHTAAIRWRSGVPDDLSGRSLATRLCMPSAVAGHLAQVRSSSTTIRSACRTQ
jgi:hypothetical protein